MLSRKITFKNSKNDKIIKGIICSAINHALNEEPNKWVYDESIDAFQLRYNISKMFVLPILMKKKEKKAHRFYYQIYDVKGLHCRLSNSADNGEWRLYINIPGKGIFDVYSELLSEDILKYRDKLIANKSSMTILYPKEKDANE